MSCGTRKFIRVTKFLLAGVTVFCVSWIACVNEWHSGVRWGSRRVVQENLSTMRTIVAYSEGMQAELDRPSPVTCNRLPALPNVPHINRTWSRDGGNTIWQKVQGTSVSLYSAYYDERTPQRYIRILAIFHGRNISSEEPLFCQTRLINPNEYSVEVVAAKPLQIWWQAWDSTTSYVETPLLLSCPLTESLSGPSVVSIVTQPCDYPSNGFYLQPKRFNNKYARTFTICVKDLSFKKDISRNLIEWVETNKLLGAEMIDIYIDSISKENEDVLLYYRSQGYIRLFRVPINDNANRTLWQRRRDHIISYNDCLYRNIAESKYIVPLDVDEILLPKISFTWPALIKRLAYQGWNSKQYSSILVQNIFFFDFLQGTHNYKSTVYSNKNRIYTKRDDVRIDDTDNLILQQIELIDDTDSFKYELNTLHEDGRNYRTECGTELPVPKLASHIISSAVISPVGHYSKSFMLTKRVLTAFNHYPLASLGTATVAGWSAPFNEVQLNHYKESCNSTVMEDCETYLRKARIDRSAVRLRRPLTQAIEATLCSKLNNL